MARIVRDIAQIASGTLGGLINSIGARKVHRFTLENLDTGEKIEGQFGPIDPTETPNNPVYAEHTSLGRDKPILMFLHGTAGGFSFGAQWFAMAEQDDTPAQKIKVLRKWAKRDLMLDRPPRVGFYVGTDGVNFGPAVIWNIGDISYFDPPKHSGAIRGVTTTITLKEYSEWELVSEPAPETRYHHARQGDYYELIAWFEYRNAMLGEIVRQRNPDLLYLVSGSIVPLPSLEALKTSRVHPQSIVFSDTDSTKDSPQKRLRSESFTRHDRAYMSNIVPEGF
jgi:hypothetical protein